MRTRHRIPMIFSLSMMDVFCCTLGCVILLWLINQREALLRAKSASDVSSQLSIVRSDLADAVQERDDLRRRLAVAQGDLAQSRQQVEATRRDLAAARVRSDELDKALAAARAAAADTADRLAKKTQDAQAATQQMASALQRVADLETLLRSKTDAQTAAAARAAELAELLAKSDTRMAQLKSTVDADAAKTREQLAAAESRLRTLEKDLSQRDRDLESARQSLTESLSEKRSLTNRVAKLQGSADARFEGIALTGRRVVFLVDMSGSMELVDENTTAPEKWSGVRDTLVKIMGSLPDLEKYQIILFSDKATYLFGQEGRWLDFDAGGTPARVATAMASVKPRGNTNMFEALDAAFRYKSMGLDTLYMFSDGLPNIGAGLSAREAQTLKETDRCEILSKHIRLTLKKQWNPPAPARVRINTIGFFYESPDVGAFLWALARENDGGFVGMSRP